MDKPVFGNGPGNRRQRKGCSETVKYPRSSSGVRLSNGWWKPFIPAFLFMIALTACSVRPTNHSLIWSQLPPLPDALGVAGPFAGVSGGVLLVGGGANFPGQMPWEGGKKVWHDEVYALADAKSSWKLVGKLPHPLAYGVSITTPAGLICIGGSDADRHYSEVFRLGFGNGVFSVQPLASLPTPLANAAGALLGETIYIAGGSEKPGELVALNQCFALDLAQENPVWQTVPACPGKARILPVAAAGKNGFYLFGGAALEPANGKIARVYLQDAWCYESGRGWQRLADLPKPCVAGPTPAPEVDESFLLIGGDDGSHAGFQPLEKHPGFATEMLAYNVNTGRWRTNGTVPAPRATLPTVFWQNRFVLPSGEMRPGARSPEIWTLSANGCP